MKPKIKWNKFPENKPTKNDEYLCTRITSAGRLALVIYRWKKDHFIDNYGPLDQFVIAWSEKPELYSPMESKSETETK